LQLDRIEVPIISKEQQIIGHVDAIFRERNNKDCIIEMKSTNSMAHFNLDHTAFKEYLRQILYYLVLSGLEKAYLVIKYEQHEQRFFKKDNEGSLHYIREPSL